MTSIGDDAFKAHPDGSIIESIILPIKFQNAFEARRLGLHAIYPWAFRRHENSKNGAVIKPSISMAPVIMVHGEEGALKTIEVSDRPDGPWYFYMNVTATASGVAITDLDPSGHKRFYRVLD